MKRVVISAGKKALLRQWAEEYENSSFLEGDPSWFMHQVEGRENQEVMAFLASCLSYGSRPLFMPKIQRLLDLSGGNPYEWVMSHGYEQALPDSGECCPLSRLCPASARCRRLMRHDPRAGAFHRSR